MALYVPDQCHTPVSRITPCIVAWFQRVRPPACGHVPTLPLATTGLLPAACNPAHVPTKNRNYSDSARVACERTPAARQPFGPPSPEQGRPLSSTAPLGRHIRANSSYWPTGPSAPSFDLVVVAASPPRPQLSPRSATTRLRAPRPSHRHPVTGPPGDAILVSTCSVRLQAKKNNNSTDPFPPALSHGG